MTCFEEDVGFEPTEHISTSNTFQECRNKPTLPTLQVLKCQTVVGVEPTLRPLFRTGLPVNLHILTKSKRIMYTLKLDYFSQSDIEPCHRITF